MNGTIVLIGCAGIAPFLRRAGFRVHQTDYFWGTEEVGEEWLAAIVDSSAGGQTGLIVAERMRRRMIVPLVLYGAEERDRVLTRFLGIERWRDEAPPELYDMLDLCVRQTMILREVDPGSSVGVIVADSMILSVATEQ
jgi:hypothetical protein